MLIASCYHDNGYNFTDRFMDYTKNQVVSILKNKIKEMKGN